MPCECKQDKAGCLCTFTAGLNVTLDGGGTASDPIIVNVEPAVLIGVNGVSTIVTVSGTGDVPDPYLLKIELDPALYAGKAGRWEGAEEELAIRPPRDGAIAVVNAPTRHLVGLTNLYGGAQRFVRVYVGDVMVADDLGGVLGPGT